MWAKYYKFDLCSRKYQSYEKSAALPSIIGTITQSLTNFTEKVFDH